MRCVAFCSAFFVPLQAFFVDNLSTTLLSNTTALSSAFLLQNRKFFCRYTRTEGFFSVSELGTTFCSTFFVNNQIFLSRVFVYNAFCLGEVLFVTYYQFCFFFFFVEVMFLFGTVFVVHLWKLRL